MNFPVDGGDVINGQTSGNVEVRGGKFVEDQRE